MKKRIIICADGTWNKPEKNLKKDVPTNILKLARSIKPIADDEIPQQVFYDWGVGSYESRLTGGITGKGLHKNIMDSYRYLVQNYSPGDDIFLFGFSRGAYTIRSLCGLINNCGIIRRPNAQLIQTAFDHYKKSSQPYAPKGEKSLAFRAKHSHPSREIAFVGVWDTVGAMGIPLSFLGLFEDKDEFYDTKLGQNVRIARHAMAIDELRSDFEPTIWLPREGLDLKQVWFSGSHSDIGGSYSPDSDKTLLSDISLNWMIHEAEIAGIKTETHLMAQSKPNPCASLHQSRRSFYRIKKKFYRPIQLQADKTLIHPTVHERWHQKPNYRPKNLQNYLNKHGWPG